MPLTPQEKRASLESVPLFRDCSSEVLDRLAEAMTEFEFATGAPIVQQGQVGNGLYIVVSGGVSIVAGSEELARLGPGDFFGELAVVTGQPRSATVEVVEDAELLRVPADKLEEIGGALRVYSM